MEIPYFIVDAFTKEPFKGNQAGVCLLPNKLDEQILQNIAFEMKLSETAFILPTNEEKDFTSNETFNLRWFTPTNEIKLCGHATLASGHVLLRELGNINETLSFTTKSGLLQVKKNQDFISMDFPLNEPIKIEPDKGLQNRLGIEDEEIEAWAYDPNLMNYLIEVKNKDIVERLVPNFGELLKYQPSEKIVGVIVTSKMEGEFDFGSRFFLPWLGIDEDPVTGATHTNLGPYWSKKSHKKDFLALQMSKRTGILHVQVLDERVIIKGHSRIVLKGTLYV